VETSRGHAYPLGATIQEDGVNFSLFSKNATSVQLLFFDGPHDPAPSHVFNLDHEVNRTFYYWHIFVQGVGHGQTYAYRVDGPYRPETGERFNKLKLLLDPYTKSVACEPHWSRLEAYGFGDNTATAMRSAVIDSSDYDWEGDEPLGRPMDETVIYEMHVGGFTRHQSSGATHPGTFAGVVEKIPYLRDLGITAVELLPVQQFDAQDVGVPYGPGGQRLTNYWGYAPVAFGAPHGAYCVSPDPADFVREFRDMVKALHRAGLEVILDVVFNHTAEGDESGPTISFKGLENRAYYMLQPDPRLYFNFSGTGNTINSNHSIVRRLIIDSLHRWVQEMHVDGFRFDLASVMSRDEDGEPMMNPPIVWSIESDPVLANTKIIAEAWDAAGLYQVGEFTGERWAEWNGRYRDQVRRFVKGDPGTVRELACRLIGSTDLVPEEEQPSYQSINFIACHDGFTLNDLVSYNEKHNEANGEDNRDGHNANYSWNCGVEGPTDDPAVERLRQRQIKNVLTILFVSQGTPMLWSGDEVRRTQRGSNNAYCQDNEISWFDWGLLERHADVYRFCRGLLHLRHAHPTLRKKRVFECAGDLRGCDPTTTTGDVWISWHGLFLCQPDWGYESRSLAFTLNGVDGDASFHVILNAYWEELPFELPALPHRGTWLRVVDTSLDPPHDLAEPGREVPVSRGIYRVGARSAVVLMSGTDEGSSPATTRR
jgi:glycogen operon protein